LDPDNIKPVDMNKSKAPRSNVHELGHEYSCPNFFAMESGECLFLYEIELPMPIKDAYVNQELTMRLAITPSPLPVQQSLGEFEEFQRLLSAFYVEKPVAIRCVYKTIRVIQPFAVSYKAMLVRNTNVINVVVENKHRSAMIKIHDVQMYLYDNRNGLENNSKKIDEIGFQKYFKFSISKDGMPVPIAPSDEHSFVGIIEPIVQMDFPNLSQLFHATLSFTWTIQTSQFSILTSHSIPLVPPIFQELMVAIQAPSPVPLNSIFTLNITVTNFGSKTRDLSVVIGPIKNEILATSLNVDQDEEKFIESKVKVPPPPDMTKLSMQPLEYFDSRVQNQPNIICLEKSLRLGSLNPKSSLSTNLQFIALKEGLMYLDKISLVDSVERKAYEVTGGRQVYVRDFSRK